MKKKIILFGGFGFIGKNIYEKLIEEFEIVIIDRICDKKFISNYPNIQYYLYEFSSQNELIKIMEKENPNYIINLISIVTAERDLKLFNSMVKSNLDILLKIYESTKGLEKLELNIQFGSGEEYGNLKNPFSELNKEYPMSPYAIVKVMVTNTSLMLYENYNYPICVVRPSNIFGKYQDKNKFIPYIIEKLRLDEEVLTTKGEQKRDFIYIDTFVKKIEDILNKSKVFKGEIINLGSGKSYSLKKIIKIMKEELNSKSKINFGAVEYRKNEMMDFCLDISKLENKLEKNIKINFFEDLKKYIKEVK